jgi:hypothetical protein
MKFLLFTISVLMILPAIALHAGSLERQHGAHVHGQATGTLAVDDGRVTLSLLIPGVNLVGFEHAPNDDVQRQLLHSVKQALGSGDWIELDPGGNCRLESIELDTPGFAEDSEHHPHDHDHGHGQDHAHHHSHEHDHDHAEFRLDIHIECEQTERLEWVALDLFDDYPANEELRIDVLTDTRAERVRLTANRTRIHLR